MAIQHDPAIETPANLHKSFEQITEYENLGPNWDGEDALPVDPGVARRAKNLLQLTAARAGLLGLCWETPTVAPNPEGGIEFTWENGDRWVLLIVGPGSLDIGCSRQENGAEPCYQSVPEDEAVEAVLWALTV